MTKKRKVKATRVIDVGRKGHHYLQVDILTGKGPRGGKTSAKLITKKELVDRLHPTRNKKRK